MTLKLYRLMAQSALGPVGGVDLEEVRSAIVWAENEQDAIRVLAEAFDAKHDTASLQNEVGYFGIPANPYVVTEEIKPRRGLVIAEGQDG